jgi:hypothetical protein
MDAIPIDWANVDWVYVAILAVIVFFSTLIGTIVAFKRPFLSAILSTLLFVAGFVFWTYYPHHLPLPTRLTEKAALAPAATPAAPAAPQKPANPVTDITPPKNPVTDITPPASKPQ